MMTSISNVYIAYYGPGVMGGNFVHVISLSYTVPHSSLLQGKY